MGIAVRETTDFCTSIWVTKEGDGLSSRREIIVIDGGGWSDNSVKSASQDVVGPPRQ